MESSQPVTKRGLTRRQLYWTSLGTVFIVLLVVRLRFAPVGTELTTATIPSFFAKGHASSRAGSLSRDGNKFKNGSFADFNKTASKQHHSLRNSKWESRESSFSSRTQNKSHASRKDHSHQSPRIRILGFVSADYFHHGLRWYEELINLGYGEYATLGALDESAAHLCKNHHRHKVKTISCYFNESLDEDLLTNVANSTLYSSQHQHPRLHRRRQMFAARWKCVRQQLARGFHVLLSDVDVAFQRYIALEGDPWDAFDVMHSYGGGYPVRVQKEHGFTVCGCLVWLRATRPTLRYIDKLIQRCGTACDDQVVMNALWSDLSVQWKIDNPGTPGNNVRKDGANPDQLHSNWVMPIASRMGVSPVTGHRVRIWNRNFAYRGPLEARPCPDEPWVVMPANQNGQKTVDRWTHFCPTT